MFYHGVFVYEKTYFSPTVSVSGFALFSRTWLYTKEAYSFGGKTTTTNCGSSHIERWTCQWDCATVAHTVCAVTHYSKYRINKYKLCRCFMATTFTSYPEVLLFDLRKAPVRSTFRVIQNTDTSLIRHRIIVTVATESWLICRSSFYLNTLSAEWSSEFMHCSQFTPNTGWWPWYFAMAGTLQWDLQCPESQVTCQDL